MIDRNIEELLNEMTILNNELVNTQRNLVKKNAEIEKLNQQLKSVNIELEQFTYIASHDLNEPLRTIKFFMETLEEEYAVLLDEKAQKYIYLAVDGATRMSALINELLTYAKLGSDESSKELTDINIVLDEIIKMQQGVLAEKEATVTYEPMPSIIVFKTPVKILLQNLISNGMKYMPKEVKPEIKVSFKENADNYQFGITDNGIGISANNHKKIFQLFTRLHSTDKYAGTGMGLATCKKIVEKHGGEIWVESEEGNGSTFYFTVKK